MCSKLTFNERCNLQFYQRAHDDTYCAYSLVYCSYNGGYVSRPYHGSNESQATGEARTSTGYKKTAVKAKKYFTPFIELCFIDLLCCVVIPFPIFSMIWTGYCIFCEFKSVREKSWEKAELRKAEKTMSVIIENKDDIAKIMAQILFDNENKKEDKK